MNFLANLSLHLGCDIVLYKLIDVISYCGTELATVLDEDWEWEKDHEKMAEALKGVVAMETQLQPSLEYYNDDEELDLDEVNPLYLFEIREFAHLRKCCCWF